MVYCKRIGHRWWWTTGLRDRAHQRRSTLVEVRVSDRWRTVLYLGYRDVYYASGFTCDSADVEPKGAEDGGRKVKGEPDWRGKQTSQEVSGEGGLYGLQAVLVLPPWRRRQYSEWWHQQFWDHHYPRIWIFDACDNTHAGKQKETNPKAERHQTSDGTV